MRKPPRSRCAVGESGTGGGFERFCAGETDISDASRPIKEDEEAPICADAGVEYTELQVATDALTVVVHPDLAVDCLTTDQLIELWAPGSTITNWNQLDPSFPDQEISPVRSGHRLGHLRLHGRRRDRRRVRDDSRRLRGLRGRQRPRAGCLGHRGCDRLLRLHLLRAERGLAEGAGHRRRQRLRRALRRDGAGRGVHAAGPAAVHLREQRQVHRQRGHRRRSSTSTSRTCPRSPRRPCSSR